ncbi:MAG: Clp protease N-terminal domain-containing protein [Acidimicrobiia bacterium]
MFERFTDQARRAVVLAQEEARLLNHNYIGTEHLLLGLLSQETSAAAVVLAQVGVIADTVRAEVERIVGRGKGERSGYIPFTPHASKALELALRESMQLGDNHVGTAHLLLGLIRDDEDITDRVFEALGVDVSDLRQAVLAAMRDVRHTDETDGDPDER